MKTLSIQQPWAWLIVNRFKPVENRTWWTCVRGWVQIHAGKKFDLEGYNWVRSNFPDIAMPMPAEFERGGIVGRAQITDCFRNPSACPPDARKWFFGPNGFWFSNAQPEPFRLCRGALGFFEAQDRDDYLRERELMLTGGK